MKYNDMLRIAIEQTALDMNCRTEDLTEVGNTVVSSRLNIEAKKCYKDKIYCGFAYYGKGMVATVDDEIKPVIEEYVAKNSGYRCFDAPQIMALNKKLEKYGWMVCHLAEFFLPDMDKPVEVNKDLEIEVFYEDQIPQFFEDDRFHNALGYDNTRDKKDVIAVVGYIDGKIAGMAGASNDCDRMWQIGIDVLEEYRQMKVAVTLTKALTDEIVKAGRVPYYCTAWSNIASKRNAIRSGYKSAWVELTAKDIRESMKYIED